MSRAAGLAIVVDDYALEALPGLDRDLAIRGAMVMRSFRGLPNPSLLRRFRGAAVVGAADRLALVARLERAAAAVRAPVLGVLPAGVRPEALRGPGIVDLIPAGTRAAAERVLLMAEVPIVSSGPRAGVSHPDRGAPPPLTPAAASVTTPPAEGGTVPGALPIVVASSTGGVWVLAELLRALGKRDRPVFVAQHMEAEFVGFLAEWLAGVSGWPTTIVDHPAPFRAGTVHLAPGGRDLVLGPGVVMTAPATSRYVPSGDRLLASAAATLAPRVVGVVLSGMGSDGAEGLAELARRGGVAVCQAPASAVVSSMPESAARLAPGAVVVPPEGLAAAVGGG